MTDGQKRDELEIICKPGHRTLTDNGEKVRKFLKWLGNECIRKPGYHVKSRDIYFRWIWPKRGTIPFGELPANHAKLSFDGDAPGLARTFVRDARNIISARLKEKRTEGVEIRMPEEKPRPSSSKEEVQGAYTLTFESIEVRLLYKPGYPVNLGSAAMFWARLIQPIKPHQGLMIYSNEQEDQATDFSGTGEVAAALLLGRKTAHLRSELRPFLSKNSLTPQTNTWLVFLGSPVSNRALSDIRVLPPWNTLQTFRFMDPPENSLKGTPPQIVNNDKGLYFQHRPRKTFESEVDYALISYFRGDSHGQVLIAMAGTTTVGTLAAAEMLCIDANVDQLTARLGIAKEGLIESFEVVLEVTVHNKAPLTMKIVYPEDPLVRRGSAN